MSIYATKTKSIFRYIKLEKYALKGQVISDQGSALVIGGGKSLRPERAG
jgi:hypothetical protein